MTAVDHEKEAEKAEYRKHVGDFDAYVQDEEEKAIRREAERRVIAVRGSDDVPGFEACVDAEMVNIAEEQRTRESDPT